MNDTYVVKQKNNNSASYNQYYCQKKKCTIVLDHVRCVFCQAVVEHFNPEHGAQSLISVPDEAD